MRSSKYFLKKGLCKFHSESKAFGNENDVNFTLKIFNQIDYTHGVLIDLPILDLPWIQSNSKKYF